MARACARARWTLLVLLALGLQSRLAQAVAAADDRGYLIPFMWHGPNNQLNAVKETLALGMLLNRTVAVPDLRTHRYTDGGTEPMPFEELLDFEQLRQAHDVVLLRNVKHAWDKRLKAALILVKPEHATSDTLRQLSRGMGFKSAKSHHWLMSPVNSRSGCAQAQLDELRAMLQPYSQVAVHTFHGLVYGSHWLSGPPDCNGNVCCEAFKTVCRHFHKSPRIYALADAFVKKHIGGEPFISAHVRPYPDPCLEVWSRNDTAGPKERAALLRNKCFNAYLYNRLGKHITYLVLKYNVSRVFIMAHPDVRTVVRARLATAGITPIFMDLEHFREAEEDALAAGTISSTFAEASFSLLAMVEEAVASYGVAFVGTKESSMTGTIAQERTARGISPNDTYAFNGRIEFKFQPANLLEMDFSASLVDEAEGGEDAPGEDEDGGGGYGEGDWEQQQAQKAHQAQQLGSSTSGNSDAVSMSGSSTSSGSSGTAARRSSRRSGSRAVQRLRRR